MTLPKEITVTIPAQKYDFDKYTSPTNCYIAEAIRKLYPNKQINVTSFGITEINDIIYRPIGHFDSDILIEAFSQNKDVTLTLTNSKNPL